MYKLISCFLFSLLGILPIGSKALEPQGDFHICYFSLNNEKEVTEMQKFTEKIKQHTHCSISVKEYQTEGDYPEESFKKMIDSGVRCDGLVISGHHTGAFGGKRSRGSLHISFLEKLSCDPKYSKWFNQVNALWLQGCRTLGPGDIVIDEDVSADYHTARVGAVLEEDHLEQSIADLNMEFSATLDQDNPLSSRYLRAFPGATVFGWTKTAPGERSGSQYSIPFHMAHISKIINNQDAFPSDSPIRGTWTKESAVQYLNSMVGVLNGDVSNQCKEILVDAWKEHGKVQDQATEYGFYNPDLNALKPLQKTDDATLTRARFLDCLLKQSSGKKLLKVLDEILQDPKLIRYTYNAILERLQNLKEGDDLSEIKKKLKSSHVLKQFLSQKLVGPSLGILRKIDYFSFYEEIYGKNEKIRGALLKKASEAFENIPSNSYNERDYKQTLLSSLAKHKYLDNEQGIKLLSKLATDNDEDMKKLAVSVAGQVGKKAFPVLEAGVKDQNIAVQLISLQGLGHISKQEEKALSLLEQKALPILEMGIKDQNYAVRVLTMESAGGMGEKALPILEAGMKDQDYAVKSATMKSAGQVGEKALPILETGIKDQDYAVKFEAIQATSQVGEKALPILEMGVKDQSDSVRRITVMSVGGMGEEAIPILETGMKDKEEYVRLETVKSASRIGGKKALPFLEAGIKDQKYSVRLMTVIAARHVGEEAIPILEAGIKDLEGHVREATLESAGQVGEKALPILRQALKDPKITDSFKQDIKQTINRINNNK